MVHISLVLAGLVTTSSILYNTFTFVNHAKTQIQGHKVDCDDQVLGCGSEYTKTKVHNYVHLVNALDKANIDTSIFSVQNTSFWCMNGRFESPFRCKNGCVSGGLCLVPGEVETQNVY